jgi:parallel beta-helix repeat protein
LETIEITENDLTVDGDGHTVAGTGSGIGVHLLSRTAVTIKNLNVQNFTLGIYLENSSGNTVADNISQANSSDGIRLYNSSGNTFEGNTTEGNSKGIFLISSSDNTIAGNTVSNNAEGIFFSGSHSNEIYNNNFINNATQAAVFFSSANVFNLDKPTGGNYWSSHTGPDGDGDGFVDSPYIFAGGQDGLPWVLQDGWQTGPPTWPAGSTLTASGIGMTGLVLTWTPADHDDGVDEYRVFQDGVQIAAVAGSETEYEVTTLEVDTQYIFKVEACATTGECSSDGPSVTVRTLTPNEAVQELGNNVVTLDVDDRIKGSLTAKLGSAERALNRANKNSRTVAVNVLEAFINQVEAQSGKKIPQADAEALIAAAQEIIAVLSAE